MKQIIILISSIVLGIFIVSCITGENGILDSMRDVWAHEISIRDMQIVGP